MSSVRFYTLVYFALIVLAGAKVVFFQLEEAGYFTYAVAMGLTVLTASAKTALIAGYFQHLRSETRSLTYLMLMGLFAVLLLAFAATFSIF